eukprot:COSAG01_NODE_72589_length_252_cov_1.359477_1_plen_40_part_01
MLLLQLNSKTAPVKSARAVCRGRADTYLQSKVMEQFKTHL